MPGIAPGSALTFFVSPKKVSKEKRAGFVGPLRGHAALLEIDGKRRNSPCGLKHLRFFLRRFLRDSPPHDGKKLQLKLLVFVFQRRVAGLSSAAAGGSGRALFERSEFSPTPLDASSARNRAAALSSARLLFGDFLLARQEKVTALPGAQPGKTISTGARPDETINLDRDTFGKSKKTRAPSGAFPTGIYLPCNSRLMSATNAVTPLP